MIECTIAIVVRVRVWILAALLASGCHAKPGATLQLPLADGVVMSLVYVPPGAFRMGSSASDGFRQGDEVPHMVSITRGFYIGRTEVTQDQWRAVMGENPSYLWGDDRPVEHVSWHDAVRFCRRLSMQVGRDCRLPSEAQWEYACRAGNEGAFSFGDDESILHEHAWYSANSLPGKTHRAAGKRPNAWGLFDMHGNVREWCADWYGPYPAVGGADPAGPANGTRRVVRGGSWGMIPILCRSAARDSASPDDRSQYIGLRVVIVER